MALRLLDSRIETSLVEMAQFDEELECLMLTAEDIDTVLMDSELGATFAYDTPQFFQEHLRRRIQHWLAEEEELRYFRVAYEEAEIDWEVYGATLIPQEQLKDCQFFVGAIFAGATEREQLCFVEFLCVTICDGDPENFEFVLR